MRSGRRDAAAAPDIQRGDVSEPAGFLCHFQSRISGMSSPYREMYCGARSACPGSPASRRRRSRRAADPVDHVLREVEAVDVVADDHVERRRRRALLLVAADVQVVVAVRRYVSRWISHG